ncbi:hypothetical protein B0H14DRAFT_2577841 [Mycena olivaceomarginata]|nr:hypothetical protein B0H14DRAFT_2577841 [Mycena olivaceomarginata]
MVRQGEAGSGWGGHKQRQRKRADGQRGRRKHGRQADGPGGRGGRECRSPTTDWEGTKQAGGSRYEKRGKGGGQRGRPRADGPGGCGAQCRWSNCRESSKWVFLPGAKRAGRGRKQVQATGAGSGAQRANRGRPNRPGERATASTESKGGRRLSLPRCYERDREGWEEPGARGGREGAAHPEDGGQKQRYGELLGKFA